MIDPSHEISWPRAQSSCPRKVPNSTQETSTNRRIQTISGKKEAECKGKEAQTSDRANQGGWRSNTLGRQNDQETHKEWGRPTSQIGSKACSSSIRDRWLGPCCSVQAAAQRLRSFLGHRRRRRRCRRCSADPSHGTAAYPPCSRQRRPLKVDKRYLPAIL